MNLIQIDNNVFDRPTFNILRCCDWADSDTDSIRHIGYVVIVIICIDLKHLSELARTLLHTNFPLALMCECMRITKHKTFSFSLALCSYIENCNLMLKCQMVNYRLDFNLVSACDANLNKLNLYLHSHTSTAETFPYLSDFPLWARDPNESTKASKYRSVWTSPLHKKERTSSRLAD